MPITVLATITALAPVRTLALIVLAASLWHLPAAAQTAGESVAASTLATTTGDRGPVDVALSADGRWLVTANQISGSVSLIDVAASRVVDEVHCGGRTTGVALSPDGHLVLATSANAGQLRLWRRAGNRLTPLTTMAVGPQPRGVVFAPDGRSAYVALEATGKVVVVDVAHWAALAAHGIEDDTAGAAEQSAAEPAAEPPVIRRTHALRASERATPAEPPVIRRIGVGHWPRTLALSPDGARLAVGTSGDLGVAVADAHSGEHLWDERFAALNIGQMQVSADGRYAYFPWIVYRGNPITRANIRRGWVLASRVARVRLDGPARREAIALDPEGQAVGDPHGVGLSPDGRWLVVSASGTQELLRLALEGLPFEDYGGPGDHIDAALLADTERFTRIPLGGRPMALQVARDSRYVYVANELLSAVQVVDLESRRVTHSIELGRAEQPSLARRGEAIFHDARRSFEQWYSCHSCHFEGGTNAVTMDTRNDGGFGSFKTVLSLDHVVHTGPWTWHGWQDDLAAAVHKSLTETMLGPEPSEADVEALVAYLQSRPALLSDLAHWSDPAAVERGRAVFTGERAGCANCHSGEFFSDGLVHDVGTGAAGDRYEGYNTPSLRGVYRRVRLLHDGRARSLEELLTGPHAPERVGGTEPLSADELADLVAYLRTL